jgi:hypothetical protein
MLAHQGMTHYRPGMTKKIAISVPDDVAARLEREPNVSAYVTESVRIRMDAEEVRRKLITAGFEITEEGMRRARAELDAARGKITPELRRHAAELQARIRRGQA